MNENGLTDYLDHMPQAATEACGFVEGLAKDGFLEDKLSKWAEDIKYVNRAKAKLAASNKEFAKYRDTQCEFLASLSGNGAGNAHEMGRLACVSELNNRRAEQLLDAVSDLPLK